MLGETLLHYRILRKLGAGGMGEVYLAHDTKLGRDVAVKILPPQLSSDPDRLERFRREASIVAALNHPNIVTIFSVEEAGGLHFFTMEHVDGEVLSALVPDDGLPMAEFRRLAIPLVDALSAAHSKGVTHRDLKPGNIMVNRNDHLKVLDFGLAKVQMAETQGAGSDSLAETDFLTGHGQILGTTPYMSPEQLKGRPADHRSDIFALGTVLYSMATGCHPFDAGSTAEIISSILGHTPARVDELTTGLPDGLGEIIDRCLDKDPDRRFQSTRDLKEALETCFFRDSGRVGDAPRHPVTGAETDAIGRRSPRRSGRVFRPRGRWAVTAVVVGALLLGAGLVWKTRSHPIPSLRSLAVLPFANLSGDPELDRLAEGIGAGLITSLREIEGVRVVGRTESWSRSGASPEDILRDLGVGALVTGEIQQHGVELRNTVSLTDAATGFVLWSHTYSTAADRVYRTEQSIARDLATFLSIPLTTADRLRMADDGGSQAAYDYFVTGHRFLDADTDPHGPDSAAENFRQALRIAPDFVLAHVGLSEALWQIHHRDGDRQALIEAEEEAETAARIDPEDPTAQVALARIHRTTGRNHRAIEQLEDVLARHPRPDEAYRELARSYERIGDLDEAETSFRAATALRADDWSNWNALGTFLVKRGRYEDARAAFIRAVDLAPPDIVRPREQLATYSLAMGRFDDAIDAFEKIPAAARGPALASNLGTAYFFSDRPDKWERAEQNYLLAVRLSPKDAIYQANLGDLYEQIGRRDASSDCYLRARALVEERLEVDPDDPNLLTQLADFSAKAGDCDTALRLAGDLASALQDTGPNAHQLAYIYAMCDDDEAALRAIRRAVELGESAELILQEDEFQALRSRPEFRALVDPR